MPQVALLMDALYVLDAKICACKEALAASLYELIGATSDGKSRNKLLQLRRDIYNRRSLAPELLASVQQLLPTSVAQAVAEFEALQESSRQRYGELKHVYNEEVTALRRTFQQSIRHADFQKGLALSSPSLFSAQQKYFSACHRELQGKQKKIERGLMRYFSRATMKATPFGTFCQVLPGRFLTSLESDETEQPAMRLCGDPAQKRSFVRLNKALYGILFEHLKTRPYVREHLYVQPNPTIREIEDRLVFLALVKGQEAFQRLSKNPVLDFILECFRHHARVRLGSLAEALATHPAIEASAEEANQYLVTLIEIGWLRFWTGIGEQEADWDVPFIDALEPVDDEHAHQAVTLLKQLRSKADAYGAAAIDERATLLEETRTLIRGSFKQLEINLQPTRQLAFYEDATADAVVHIPRSGLTHVVEHLREFVGLTLPLAWQRLAQANMRHFFDTHYGAETASVALLTFYEDYYREHFKEYQEKQQRARAGLDIEGYDLSNPFNLDLVKQIQNAHAQLNDLIARRCKENPAATEITLGVTDLEPVLQGVPPASPDSCSISLFAQIVPPAKTGEVPVLVLPDGRYLVGYGKYFSRFLHLFPEVVQERLYRANDALTDHYLAEIRGDANYNANLHPPLLRWNITYPTSESKHAETHLHCSDLYVEPKPGDSHALCLRHGPTSRRVLPVDLGFLNLQMRPPLYQLLTHFSPAASFSLSMPAPRTPSEQRPKRNGSTNHQTLDKAQADAQSDAALDTPSSTDPAQLQIQYSPRVTYRNTLVLLRKCWRVPASLFPEQHADESEFDYFVRVNRWRRLHSIPREVYARIRPLARTTRLRDWHKPQYIDFDNPLLVNLFGRMAVNLEHNEAILEERFPGKDALPRYGDATYATELILQLNLPQDAFDVVSDLHQEEQYHASFSS